MKKVLFALMLCLSISARANVSFGGYVPFGLSTQTEADGGTGTFDFDPMISLSHVVPNVFLGQMFLPEIGFVLHTGEFDGYSKTTSFILLDLGHQLSANMLFRYGVGTFMTNISGDGEAVVMPNGNGTSTYYTPSKSEMSFNSTLNLGLEGKVGPRMSLRFETYIFSLFDKLDRKLSYSLGLTYFL